MSTILDLVEAIKHLPGRHDQYTHNPHKGAGKGSGASAATTGSVPSSISKQPYTSFDNADRAHEWMTVNEDKPKTDSEAGKVQGYIESGFINMNRLLRGQELREGYGEKPEIKSYIKAVGAYVARNQLPEDLVLWRGTRSDMLTKAIESGQDLVGTTITDKGFKSCSLLRSVSATPTFLKEDNSVIFEIHAPKGATGAITDNRKEAEVILPPSTNYKIMEVHKEKDGASVIVVELVQ